MLYEVRRKIYSRKFHDFVQAAWHVIEPSSSFIDGEHVRAICAHLQAVYEGKIEDLVINVPPGMTKSMLFNVFFPAWVWTIDPTRRFFHATYDSTLSTRDSVLCRQLLDSEWYKTHFPGVVEFTTDENQKTFYKNTAGGYRMATSVGGHGTGEHPHFIIADDPNNVKQAESVKQRAEVELWWTQTMGTRGLTVGSRRIVVQQRLHERDLTGVCLELGGYDHLCLEMRCEKPGRSKTKLNYVDPREEGKLLCPALLPEKALVKLEALLGPYGIAGQLQQRPVPRKGGLFDVSKFKTVDACPNDLVFLIRAWDPAASSKGDFCAGVKMGKQLSSGLFFVVDVKRGQWETAERNAIMRSTADADKDDVCDRNVMQWHKTEPGSGGKDQAVNFLKMMAGHSCGEKRDTGNKEVRADPFAGQVNAGNVVLVKGPWNRDFIEECRVAPNGANDDQWDAAATAFNWIELRARPSLIPDGWTFGAEMMSEESASLSAEEAQERMRAILELNDISY
jgi:predicted phage terminase large subunit-like protein